MRRVEKVGQNLASVSEKDIKALIKFVDVDHQVELREIKRAMQSPDFGIEWLTCVHFLTSLLGAIDVIIQKRQAAAVSSNITLHQKQMLDLLEKLIGDFDPAKHLPKLDDLGVLERTYSVALRIARWLPGWEMAPGEQERILSWVIEVVDAAKNRTKKSCQIYLTLTVLGQWRLFIDRNPDTQLSPLIMRLFLVSTRMPTLFPDHLTPGEWEQYNHTVYAGTAAGVFANASQADRFAYLDQLLTINTHYIRICFRHACGRGLATAVGMLQHVFNKTHFTSLLRAFFNSINSTGQSLYFSNFMPKETLDWWALKIQEQRTLVPLDVQCFEALFDDDGLELADRLRAATLIKALLKERAEVIAQCCPKLRSVLEKPQVSDPTFIRTQIMMSKHQRGECKDIKSLMWQEVASYSVFIPEGQTHEMVRVILMGDDQEALTAYLQALEAEISNDPVLFVHSMTVMMYFANEGNAGSQQVIDIIKLYLICFNSLFHSHDLARHADLIQEAMVEAYAMLLMVDQLQIVLEPQAETRANFFRLVRQFGCLSDLFQGLKVRHGLLEKIVPKGAEMMLMNKIVSEQMADFDTQSSIVNSILANHSGTGWSLLSAYCQIFNAHFSGMSNGNIDEAISHVLNIIPDVDEFNFNHNAFDLPAMVSALEAFVVFYKQVATELYVGDQARLQLQDCFRQIGLYQLMVASHFQYAPQHDKLATYQYIRGMLVHESVLFFDQALSAFMRLQERLTDHFPKNPLSCLQARKKSLTELTLRVSDHDAYLYKEGYYYQLEKDKGPKSVLLLQTGKRVESSQDLEPVKAMNLFYPEKADYAEVLTALAGHVAGHDVVFSDADGIGFSSFVSQPTSMGYQLLINTLLERDMPVNAIREIAALLELIAKQKGVLINQYHFYDFFDAKRVLQGQGSEEVSVAMSHILRDHLSLVHEFKWDKVFLPEVKLIIKSLVWEELEKSDWHDYLLTDGLSSTVARDLQAHVKSMQCIEQLLFLYASHDCIPEIAEANALKKTPMAYWVGCASRLDQDIFSEKQGARLMRKLPFLLHDREALLKLNLPALWFVSWVKRGVERSDPRAMQLLDLATWLHGLDAQYIRDLHVIAKRSKLELVVTDQAQGEPSLKDQAAKQLLTELLECVDLESFYLIMHFNNLMPGQLGYRNLAIHELLSRDKVLAHPVKKIIDSIEEGVSWPELMGMLPHLEAWLNAHRDYIAGKVSYFNASGNDDFVIACFMRYQREVEGGFYNQLVSLISTVLKQSNRLVQFASKDVMFCKKADELGATSQGQFYPLTDELATGDQFVWALSAQSKHAVDAHFDISMHLGRCPYLDEEGLQVATGTKLQAMIRGELALDFLSELPQEEFNRCYQILTFLDAQHWYDFAGSLFSLTQSCFRQQRAQFIENMDITLLLDQKQVVQVLVSGMCVLEHALSELPDQLIAKVDRYCAAQIPHMLKKMKFLADQFKDLPVVLDVQDGLVGVTVEQQCLYQVPFHKLSQISHKQVTWQCYKVLAENPMNLLRVILAGYNDYLELFAAMQEIGNQELAICRELAVLCHLKKPLSRITQPKFHQFDLVANKQHLIDYERLLSERGFDINWFEDAVAFVANNRRLSVRLILHSLEVYSHPEQSQLEKPICLSRQMRFLSEVNPRAFLQRQITNTYDTYSAMYLMRLADVFGIEYSQMHFDVMAYRGVCLLQLYQNYFSRTGRHHPALFQAAIKNMYECMGQHVQMGKYIYEKGQRPIHDLHAIGLALIERCMLAGCSHQLAQGLLYRLRNVFGSVPQTFALESKLGL